MHIWIPQNQWSLYSEINKINFFFFKKKLAIHGTNTHGCTHKPCPLIVGYENKGENCIAINNLIVLYVPLRLEPSALSSSSPTYGLQIKCLDLRQATGVVVTTMTCAIRSTCAGRSIKEEGVVFAIIVLQTPFEIVRCHNTLKIHAINLLTNGRAFGNLPNGPIIVIQGCIMTHMGRG